METPFRARLTALENLSHGARLVGPGPLPRASKLRIATYNVHKCRGLDGRVRPARIAKVLREVGADVVALQEVLSVAGGGRERDQPRFLADELDVEMQFGAVRSHRGGQYGNLVLSTLPLGPGRLYDLSVAGREERGCLRVDVRLTERTTLHVFNVHLGTSLSERRQQGPRLLDAVIRKSTDLVGPRVLLGDFNDWGAVLACLLATFVERPPRSHYRAVWVWFGVASAARSASAIRP